MACAHALPERVSRLELVSSLAPLDAPAASKGMNAQSQALFDLAAADPSVFATQIEALLNSGMSLYQIITSGLPDEDQSLFAQEPLCNAYQRNMIEATRSGADGIISDFLLYAQPWGFAPSNIRCDTRLWQGLCDINVPPAMGQHLASIIPDCRATFIEHAAHYLLYRDWREILAQMVVD